MLTSSSDLDRYYQLLGLDRGASLDRVKSAYRTLARKFHPDLNPGDDEAHQRFITLSEAYQVLLTIEETPSGNLRAYPPSANSTNTTPAESTTDLNSQDAELKWQLYYELQALLREQKFLKAIALIEGLAQKYTTDHQICQWQGIIYSQFGYKSIERREFDKAQIYLKKALKVDPYNRQLWDEVTDALNRISR